MKKTSIYKGKWIIYMKKKLVRLTESDLHRMVVESVNKILSEESYVDRMVNSAWRRFDRSGLKPIFDNLGLKRGGGGFSLGGDFGYTSFKLYNPNVEFRDYDKDGRVFVFFGYDPNAGALGGFTRKYEVKDPDIFKNPNWKRIIQKDSTSTSPDVIMMR